MKCFAKNERQESRVNAVKHASRSNMHAPTPTVNRERFNDSGTRRRTHKMHINVHGMVNWEQQQQQQPSRAHHAPVHNIARNLCCVAPFFIQNPDV